jgi:hypothetical protein
MRLTSQVIRSMRSLPRMSRKVMAPSRGTSLESSMTLGAAHPARVVHIVGLLACASTSYLVAAAS